jgi:hypothetical protein
LTADYKVTAERLFYRVLAECSNYCTSAKDAEREMQEALNVPGCKVETLEDADEFVESVSGFQDFWSLEEEKRLQFQDLTETELIQKGSIRERSVEEVIGHLQKLTGLKTEDMHNDPEGTYLEIIGRLRNYRIHQQQGKITRNTVILSKAAARYITLLFIILFMDSSLGLVSL